MPSWHASLNAMDAAILKAISRRVDFVIGTVVQFHAHVDYLIARQNTCLHRFLNTFVDLRNVFLRNRTADDGILEFVAGSRLSRIYSDLDMTVLTAAAGLLRILVVHICRSGQSLLVGNLRFSDIRFHLELSEQTIHDDIEMQAHPYLR